MIPPFVYPVWLKTLNYSTIKKSCAVWTTTQLWGVVQPDGLTKMV